MTVLSSQPANAGISITGQTEDIGDVSISGAPKGVCFVTVEVRNSNAGSFSPCFPLCSDSATLLQFHLNPLSGAHERAQ
jgi:hypothetical protein